VCIREIETVELKENPNRQQVWKTSSEQQFRRPNEVVRRQFSRDFTKTSSKQSRPGISTNNTFLPKHVPAVRKCRSDTFARYTNARICDKYPALLPIARSVIEKSHPNEQRTREPNRTCSTIDDASPVIRACIYIRLIVTIVIHSPA